MFKIPRVRLNKNEYDMVFGSRKVIKDANNPDQNHFYITDIWTEEGKKLQGLVPEGFLVYAELIGWTESNAPIQKAYTYQVPQGTADLYIYRVARINGEGVVTDLSWDQVIEWCKDRGLKHVPELWRGKMKEIREHVQEKFCDIKFVQDGYINCVPTDEESPCDEGVCIRMDGLAPYIVKAKSPLFYEHETKMLDEEAVDLEEEQS